MIEPLDDYPQLIDASALDEIEMTSKLMIAASGCPGKLSQVEVDEILGVTGSPLD